MPTETIKERLRRAHRTGARRARDRACAHEGARNSCADCGADVCGECGAHIVRAGGAGVVTMETD